MQFGLSLQYAMRFANIILKVSIFLNSLRNTFDTKTKFLCRPLCAKHLGRLTFGQPKHEIACRDWNNLVKCREREQQNVAVIKDSSYRDKLTANI